MRFAAAMATSLSSLNWQAHRLHTARRLRQHVVAAAAASSSSSPNQVLHAVCEQHGIRLDPSVQLASTDCGYGLCRSQHTDADPIVAVPLNLVLSCSIPGCSPAPQQMCSALEQLLHSSAVSESWEMQVAVLLLWALRQSPQSRIGSFWRQYRPLLPGGVQDCSSLLVWSAAELQQLQDPSLQATAEQWQQKVHAAYQTAVQPFFSANPAASSRTEAAEPCSLQDWFWAVASVESRAFGAARADVAAVAAGSSGITSPDGQHRAAAESFTGLVPVLDLANHTPRPQYEHRVDPSKGAFSLFVDAAHVQQQQQQPGQDARSRSDQQQMLITYGSKDNRQLMEMYGFVVPGNPFDRVRFSPDLLQDQHGWMSHKAVKAAAQQVLARQQQEQEQQQQAASRVDAAVASVIQYRGWRNAVQYAATSPDSTARCAQAMLACVRQQLQACATTAADDAVQLQRRPGGRRAAAIAYRLEQKLLLGCTAEVLEILAAGGSGGCSDHHAASMAPKMPVRAAAEQQQHSSAEDDRVMAWQQSYTLPDEAEGSREELKRLYRPPRNDAKGIAIACGLIAAWVVLFYHGCWQIKLTNAPDGSSRRSSWFDIVATFLLLEFVNTGLFITTHDAMHGTICFRNRKLNDTLGRIAITLYAYFDYSMLHEKHWEHHNFTGQPGKDPDFHRGNSNLLVWYARFMWEYTTLLQFAKIILASQVLQALGVPYANLVVYMAAAPLLAAFRLFYFGTYLPHLPPDNKTVMKWQMSHSSEDPSWLTFLKCYNFGLHWEHHRWPYAPWWELPKAKAITRQYKAQQEQRVQPDQQQAGPAVQPTAAQ